MSRKQIKDMSKELTDNKKEQKEIEKIIKKLLTNWKKYVIINTENEREVNIMEEMKKAYNEYIKALSDSSVDIDTIEALYQKWVDLKLEVEGRD